MDSWLTIPKIAERTGKKHQSIRDRIAASEKSGDGYWQIVQTTAKQSGWKRYLIAPGNIPEDLLKILSPDSVALQPQTEAPPTEAPPLDVGIPTSPPIQPLPFIPPTFAPNPPHHTTPKELRAFARIAIDTAVTELQRHNTLPLTTARHTFLAAWHANTLEVPQWVRERVPAKLCYATLHNWAKASATDLGGNYGNRRHTTKLTPEQQEFTIAHMLLPPGIIRVKLVERFGEPIPHTDTIRRFQENWIAANPNQHALMRGQDYWNSHMRSAIGDAAAIATHPLALVEVDATTCNTFSETFQLATGKRYSLICFIDVFSRRTRFYVAESVSAQAYILALRRFVLELGIPEVLKSDQGKAELSSWVDRVCKDLAITHEVCTVKSPWLKPHVERMFRSLETLLKTLPGYCGKNTVEAKEIRSRPSAAPLLTPAQLQTQLDTWCKTYESRPHRSLKGAVPLTVWVGGIATQPVRPAPDERLLDLALAPVPASSGRAPGIRRVGKEGLQVDGYDFAPHDASDVDWIGRDVFCRYDPYDNAGKLWVFEVAGDSAGQFLFHAFNLDLQSRSRRDTALLRTTKQKEINKLHKQEIKTREAIAAAAVLPPTKAEVIPLPLLAPAPTPRPAPIHPSTHPPALTPDERGTECWRICRRHRRDEALTEADLDFLRETERFCPAHFRGALGGLSPEQLASLKALMHPTSAAQQA